VIFLEEEFMVKLYGGYSDVKGVYRYSKARIVEIYHRLCHAYGIFKMRFMILTIPSHVDISDDFIFEEKNAVNRGRVAPDGNYYSSSYELEWQKIPDEIKLKIKEFDSVLRIYFGGDYLIHTANVWRNISLPENYRSLDIYSQIWHYDYVVDYRNVQLFVLLTDTTDLHGPFEFIENSSETELSKVAKERNGLGLTGGRKFTGIRGDAMLISTGAIPHRDGIPMFGNHRDIFSIGFFPKYTGIGIDAKSLLGSS
jgi:hypothetical protein